MYLAVVMDLFARKPIGWAMSFSPDSQLTGKALSMTFKSRDKPTNTLFHSEIKEVIYKSSIMRRWSDSFEVSRQNGYLF